MPLTVEDFLLIEPELVRLRNELTHRVGAGNLSESGPGRRGDRVRLEIARREARLRRGWASGCEGWLTPAEGRAVAEELTTMSERAGIVAHASVEEDGPADAWIVFYGSLARQGSTHRLWLGSSSPVRVRAHWEGFITACARRTAATSC